jgi:hypothetical protein
MTKKLDMNSGKKQKRARKKKREKKSPSCRNQDNQTARTLDVPFTDGSKKEVRGCRFELRTISLVGLITVSLYWYIRGVTPRRRIRRW